MEQGGDKALESPGWGAGMWHLQATCLQIAGEKEKSHSSEEVWGIFANFFFLRLD